MRTAIHPDRSLGAPGEVMNMNRDQLLRVAIALFPDAKTGEARCVIRWMHAALILGKRDERRVPGVGAESSGVREWDAAVVTQFGAE